MTFCLYIKRILSAFSLTCLTFPLPHTGDIVDSQLVSWSLFMCARALFHKRKMSSSLPFENKFCGSVYMPFLFSVLLSYLFLPSHYLCSTCVISFYLNLLKPIFFPSFHTFFIKPAFIPSIFFCRIFYCNSPSLDKDRLINAVQGSNGCLFWEAKEIHKCTLGKMESCRMAKQMVHTVITTWL
jgi:hypothetical protein